MKHIKEYEEHELRDLISNLKGVGHSETDQERVERIAKEFSREVTREYAGGNDVFFLNRFCPWYKSKYGTFPDISILYQMGGVDRSGAYDPRMIGEEMGVPVIDGFMIFFNPQKRHMFYSVDYDKPKVISAEKYKSEQRWFDDKKDLTGKEAENYYWSKVRRMEEVAPKGF